MREFDVLTSVLARRSQPVEVFFRDDDAGWANNRLVALCERMSEIGIALDLAVIPGALDHPTSSRILRLSRDLAATLNFHQHGYAHLNHQWEGRKCEFGSDRDIDLQRRDIGLGQKRLQDFLGSLADPIFTPPWNRCTAKTCKVLPKLGFQALSRIVGGKDFEYAGLTDISVSIDWQKKKQGVHLTSVEFCQYAESYLLHDEVVGVMLHHEHLTDDDLDRLQLFITSLRDSGKVKFRSMQQLIVSTSLRQERPTNVAV